MAFWGCEVKPGGKPTPFVPPPESSKLHLSQACLSTKAKPGAKAALRVRVTEEGEPLLVCVLREGATESVGLDLIFDQYTEFSVEGSAPIHLTGYFMPEFEMGGEDDSEDDDGPLQLPGGRLLGYDEYGMPVMADEYDSEEDSDYETEDSDEDEELGSDAEEDSDMDPPRRVVIEDVTDKERKALAAANGGKAANGKAAEFSDSDVDASDDDDDDDEEEDSEEEEEDSEEEEQQQQAAVKQQQAATAGQKRKAEQQPAAKQPAKKEAKQAAATPAGKQQAAATPAAKQQQAQQQQQQKQQAPQAQQKQQQKEAPGTAGKSKVRTFPNGFAIEDTKSGRPDGKLAKAGKKVVMKYVGRLKNNGKVFDQTKGNATFSFRLGVGEVIKGWDRGVEGMRVGDKRRLTIPPQMAYGTSGVRGTIPPNATLEFDVELVDVK